MNNQFGTLSIQIIGADDNQKVHLRRESLSRNKVNYNGYVSCRSRKHRIEISRTLQQLITLTGQEAARDSGEAEKTTKQPTHVAFG